MQPRHATLVLTLVLICLLAFVLRTGERGPEALSPAGGAEELALLSRWRIGATRDPGLRDALNGRPASPEPSAGAAAPSGGDAGEGGARESAEGFAEPPRTPSWAMKPAEWEWTAGPEPSPEPRMSRESPDGFFPASLGVPGDARYWTTGGGGCR